MNAPIHSLLPQRRPEDLALRLDGGQTPGLDPATRRELEAAARAVTGAEVDSLVTQEGLDTVQPANHSVSDADFRSLLQQDSWNRSQAIQLQTGLVERGHDLGNYGPNGDGVDGRVGPATRSAVTQARAALPPAPIQRPDAPSYQVPDARFGALLEQDNWTRPEARELQTGLVERGHDLGNYGPNRDGVDGHVGPATRSAVAQARADRAAAPPAPDEPQAAAAAEPEAAAEPSYQVPEARFGELLEQDSWTRPEARELQTGLVERGHDLGNYGPNGDGVDGHAGPATRAAVEQERADRAAAAAAAQAEQQATVNEAAAALGVPQPEAAAAAVEQVDGAQSPDAVAGPAAVEDGAESPDAEYRRLLHQENLSRDEVHTLQTHLQERGFDVGEADGIRGPQTNNAITSARAALDIADRFGADADIEMRFDGQQVHVYANGELANSYDAISGLPQGSPSIPVLNERYGLDLDPNVNYADPSMTDVAYAGPIPEGRYTLELNEGMQYEKTGEADGAGWGEGGWRLKESLYGRIFEEREGFFLHEDGGNPGTAGCVGLDKDGLLAVRGILTQAQQQGASRVRLRVDYGEPAPGTQPAAAPAAAEPAAPAPAAQMAHPQQALDAVGQVIHGQDPGAQDALVDALGGQDGVREAMDRVVERSALPNTTRWAADLAATELTTAEPTDRPVDPQRVQENLDTLRNAAGMYLFSGRREIRAHKEAINQVLVNATPQELQAMMEADPRIGEDLVRTFRMTDMAYAQMVGGYFGNEDMVNHWVHDTPDVGRNDYAIIMNPQ